jgi:hypothetical protein
MQLANQSQIAEQALGQIAQIYAVEPEVKDLNAKDRLRIRQDKSLPLVQTLHDWLMLNRQKGPEGSATAKGINYSLRRWKALTRFLQDGQLPVDNNWIENQIRPIAIGRNNCLFASSLRGGQRAAAVMSLIQSAKLNGYDPHAYLKDVLTRLPTHMNSRGYAPAGKTPVAMAIGGTRHKLSMVATVTNQGKARWMIIDEAFDAAKLIEFLQALIKDANKKVFLILDNLHVHHSKLVKAWVAEHKEEIELFYWPS